MTRSLRVGRGASTSASCVLARHGERQAEGRRGIAVREQQPGPRRRLVRALPPLARFASAGRRPERRGGEPEVAGPQRDVEVERGEHLAGLLVLLARQPRQVACPLRVPLGERRPRPGHREQHRDVGFTGERADRRGVGLVKQPLREEQVVPLDGHLRRGDRRQARRRGVGRDRVTQPAGQRRRRGEVAAERAGEGQPAAGPHRQGRGSRGRQLMIGGRQRARGVRDLPAAQQHRAERQPQQPQRLVLRLPARRCPGLLRERPAERDGARHRAA